MFTFSDAHKWLLFHIWMVLQLLSKFILNSLEKTYHQIFKQIWGVLIGAFK